MIYNKMILLLVILLSFLTVYAQEEDDVELRIDFTSGSVIANQPPKIVKHIPNITAALGTKDTAIIDLNDVFNDAESGSALSFTSSVIDSSIVKATIGQHDSVASLEFMPGKEGRTKVVFTASDGIKEVHDTINVVVKPAFTLSDTLSDTTVKSSYSVLGITMDITSIFPRGNANEYYNFSVTSSDAALVGVIKSKLGKSIILEIADSSYGSSDIIVTFTDSDLLTVKDTFTVFVKKSYGKKIYKRKQVNANLGFTLFTDTYYSGGALKLWIKDIFGIAIDGYYYWDQKGVGADLGLMLKPSLNFVLQPYAIVSCGYHRQTLSHTYSNLSVTVKNDIPMLTVRAAGGVDAWLGKSKNHLIGAEVGYTFGRGEYSALSTIEMGNTEIVQNREIFKMPPLHLRLSYSIFIRKL